VISQVFLPGTDTPSNKVILNDTTRAVAAETAPNPANQQALRSGAHCNTDPHSVGPVDLRSLKEKSPKVDSLSH
jgi:hypothetical protein